VNGVPPCSRWDHSFTSFNSSNVVGIIIGGRNDNTPLNDIHILSCIKNTYEWSKLILDLPMGLFNHSTFTSKEDIYIFGGISNHYSAFETKQKGILLSLDFTKYHHSWRYIDSINCIASSSESFEHNNNSYNILMGGMQSDTPIQILKADDGNLTFVNYEIINDDIDYGKLINHRIAYVPNNDFGEIICVGGGVDTFAFGQSFSKSYCIKLQSNKSSSISPKSATTFKNNETYVLYTLKKNTKKLKDVLLELNYLDLRYRISHAKSSDLDSDLYVAIPVIQKCYELYRNKKEEWMSLVLDCCVQEVLLRSSGFGNKRLK